MFCKAKRALYRYQHVCKITHLNHECPLVVEGLTLFNETSHLHLHRKPLMLSWNKKYCVLHISDRMYKFYNLDKFQKMRQITELSFYFNVLSSMDPYVSVTEHLLIRITSQFDSYEHELVA